MELEIALASGGADASTGGICEGKDTNKNVVCAFIGGIAVSFVFLDSLYL